MTQANDTAKTEAQDRSALIGIGEMLRAAREQQSLSSEQVAESLHLDEAIIIALEQEHFETLGAPVYVRGHLKTYAQLLGLSPDEIIREYHGDVPEPVAAPTSAQPAVMRATVNPVLWAGGVLTVVLGLVLGIYVLLGDEEPIDAVTADPVVAAPAADTLVGNMPPVEDTVAVSRDAPAAEIPRVVEAPVVEEAPPPQPVEVEVDDRADISTPVRPPVPRPVATMRLGLHFNQESWVEISDANRRLLFGLQREGNRREISGEPPFNLLIGNARGVELTINDEPYPVPASRVRGKVARFEITGEEFE